MGALKDLDKSVSESASSLNVENITENAVENVCITILNGIDGILGDGAHKKIFKGKTVTFYDCLDVAHYVITEISEFNKVKSSKYKQGRAKK